MMFINTIMINLIGTCEGNAIIIRYNEFFSSNILKVRKVDRNIEFWEKDAHKKIISVDLILVKSAFRNDFVI